MRLIGEALCLAAAVRPAPEVRPPVAADQVQVDLLPTSGFGGEGQLQSMTWLRKSAVFN